MREQGLVRRHDVIRDIQFAVVAHHGVQHPEKATRPRFCPRLEVLRDPAHRLDGFRAGYVAREHHVEVVEVGLLQPLVQVRDLLRRDLGALDLSVAGVITCSQGVGGQNRASERGGSLGRLTELHRIQCGNVAPERLHREDGNLVADIARLRRCGQPSPVRPRLLSGEARNLPGNDLGILSVRLCAGGTHWEEGASSYMTGDCEDASLWHWQIV